MSEQRSIVKCRCKKLRTLLSLIMTISIIICCAEPYQVHADNSEVKALQAKIKALKRQLSRRPYDPNHYPMPHELKFCGQMIRFKGGDLKKRFELELIKILKNRAQVGLYINRATSVFPVIEDIAAELKTCPDLKYVAVVESALKPRVMSHAKAVGWWQFMPQTAKGFKLKVNPYLDERSDLLASTRAALTYLTRLHKRFKGSWLMSMAGYNTGPGRLKRLVASQGQTEYWKLDLFTEAERYSPRVLAMYYVLTHLKAYDFGRDLSDGWPQEPLAVYTISLKTAAYKKRVHSKLRVDPRVYIERLALKLKVPVRDLRRYNPHLLKDRLPIGVSFHLYLPPKAGSRIRSALGNAALIKLVYRNQAARRLTTMKKIPLTLTPSQPREEPAREYQKAITRLGGAIKGTYTVRPGDQIWQIAARAKISVRALRALNGLTALSGLRIGQQLRVAP